MITILFILSSSINVTFGNQTRELARCRIIISMLKLNLWFLILIDPNLFTFHETMNLFEELDFNDTSTNYTFSTFTHRILPNNTVNYYMNDDRGISIYDQDWHFIRRVNLKSLNQEISLYGNMFIHDEFIYICNSYQNSDSQLKKFHFFLKLDFNLRIINFHHLMDGYLISMSFDSCEKRIFLLWTKNQLQYSRDGFLRNKINIDVYSLYLRKISEMNTNSINDNAITLSGRSPSIVYFNNKLYISYKDDFKFQYIMVTDIKGQYIKTYALMEIFFYFQMNSFTVDNFGNILFTSMGQLCLFDSSLNITKSCIDNLNYNEYNAIFGFSNDYPLYAQVDQSGRLVAIDSFKQKIRLYGPFGT